MTNTIIQYTQEQEQKFIAQLNDIIKNGGKNWQAEITNDHSRKVKKYTDLIEFINYKTPLLQDRHYLITTKVYWVLNGLTDFPRCKNPKCNKQIKKDIRVQFDGHKGYADFCCPKCAVSDERTQAKYKETCMNNWGVDNGSKAQEIKDKLKEIQFNRNGGLWDFQSERFKQQSRETCLQKYGQETYAWTDDYARKYEATMIERYGVRHYAQTQEFKDKYKHTMNIRYGVNAPIQCNEIRTRILQTNMDKYGVQWISEMINRGDYGQPHRSKPEIEVFEFIKNIVEDQIEVKSNDMTQMTPNERNGWRSNHELDIWIPDLRFAVEFQGNYWHDPLHFPETAYNDNEKQIQCQEKGITLVQVFESEWKNDRKFVELKLKELIDEKQTR